MLHILDDALIGFIRAEVPLAAADVDVVLDRPDRDWSTTILRPTVNLFLWDIRRNSTDQQSGMEMVETNGRTVRRPPLPRVDCRYIVTSWAGDIRDEHQLLGALMALFLQFTELPTQDLADGYRNVTPPPSLALARFDGGDAIDFWTALNGEMRPGLDLTVTATFDAAVVREVGPPIEEFILRGRRIGETPDQSDQQ